MKTVHGLILVDTPHSALNNAGEDAGSRTENAVAVKTIRRGRDIFPYISGQALRYWWRDTLGKNFDWNLSPITRETKVAFTEANPLKYDDDDIFGYMRAIKKETLTRASPLKCSPLISVISHRPTTDFGVMARHEGDPVPYEHQFYSTVMKGIFSIDLSQVGAFSDMNRTGFKNINNELKEELEKANAFEINDMWVLPQETRVKRVQTTLKALAYMFGGAKQTTHLTDVTPKLVILAVLDCGNHIFMNVVHEKNGKVHVNIEALEEVLTDYKDNIISDLYIGKSKGFLPELDAQLNDFKERYEKRTIHIGSPKEMIFEFAETVKDHI